MGTNRLSFGPAVGSMNGGGGSNATQWGEAVG
jgi:hypothetical protein